MSNADDKKKAHGQETLNPYAPFYHGASVSDTFMRRWRSRQYVGGTRPWARVSIRRGYMLHGMHDKWPGDHAPLTVRHNKTRKFGRIIGLKDFPQWYPDWTPTTDWKVLPGVAEIDIAQSVSYAGGGGGDGSGGAGGSNGIAVATITADNQAWVEVASAFGAYHERQRGWLWPWRGYVPHKRPGGQVAPNEWYGLLPNAQILVEQGWGEDVAIKTFTGLIDNIGPASIRPDRITLTARDFGGVIVDVNPFKYNKDTRIRDPMYFIPPDYPNITGLKKSKTHNWVIVSDATDIVRCILRWCGFKEWEVEDSGVGLKTAYLVDRSKTWMDVINEVAAQLGYVFFIAEPTADDLSIGVPVFRKQSVLRTKSPQPITLDSTVLTDLQPTHDNTNDRFIVRVRGRFTTRKKGGRPIVGGDATIDGQVMFTATYWPPWQPTMSGVIKQLTYYNQGSNGVLGFSSNSECMVAALLIGVQIALSRDTATATCPGNPAIGLDTMTYVNDSASSGIASRLYVTSKRSTMTLGGDGSSSSSGGNSPGSNSNDMFWTYQVAGSLVDNPEWDHLVKDYHTALSGGKVKTGGGNHQFS